MRPDERPSRDRNVKIVLACTVVFILCALTLFHKLGGGIKIPSLMLKPTQESRKSIRCVVIAKLSGKTMRLVFTIPSEDKIHWYELEDKLPKIKHSVLMLFEHQKLLEILENKDFDNLKKHILKVVNVHSSKPIEAVFLDNFFYD